MVSPDPSPPAGLPPGVTSFDIARVATWNRYGERAILLGLGVGLVLGLAPVAFGTAPVLAVSCLALATALCVGSYPLPGLVRLTVLVVGAVTGVAVLGGPDGGAGGELVSWFMGFWVGLTILVSLLSRRDRRRRLATATGAPPVDHDPRKGTDVGTLATWRDARHEYEAAEPDPEVVLDAVRRLDSVHHVYVSVYRGAGRLDVLGDQEGYVVQQTDNRLSPAWDFHVVVDPASLPRGASGERVELGYPGHRVDRARVVGLAAAETAVRTWITHGIRDRGLSWYRLTMRDAHPQPAQLRRTD